MKQLKLLGCVLALGALAFFTGCGGDNNNSNNNTPSGTNAPPNINNSTIALTPSDGSAGHSIATDAAGTGYNATFNDGTTESGTYTYTTSGDNATVVLTPSNGSATTTVNLVFSSPTAGSYTSDLPSGGSGTFTVTSNGGTP